MNGVSVPSADPDKRAVQMDQFPAEMIESVVTTKSFPEQTFVSVSASAGFNSQVEGERLLASSGNAGLSPNVAQVVPNRVSAEIQAEFSGNFEPAKEIDAASNAFGIVGFNPRVKKGSLNSSFNIAGRHRIEFGEEGLVGITASFNPSRSSTGYEGGEAGRFSGTPDSLQTNLIYTPDERRLSFNRAEVPADTPSFGVSSGTISDSQGGLLKLAVRPKVDHEVSLDLIYNEGTDDTVRRGIGEEIANYEGAIYEVYDLLRTERSVSSA